MQVHLSRSLATCAMSMGGFWVQRDNQTCIRCISQATKGTAQQSLLSKGSSQVKIPDTVAESAMTVQLWLLTSLQW